MAELRRDNYAFGGINADVNPFLMKSAELIACQNFYSHKELAKKVRFGYKRLSQRTSNGPVRNLIYFDFPNGQRGLLKISDKHIYRYDFNSLDWGAPIYTFTVDKSAAVATLAGSKNYVHISNGVDDYVVYDGLTFKPFTTANAPFTPKASVLATVNSRIYADINRLRLAGSATDFDLNPTYTNDPFLLNNNDPSGGLAQGVDTGVGGQIIGMSIVSGVLFIYKDNGAYRYVNYGTQPMNYFDTVLSRTIVNHKKTGVDYFMSWNSIMKNDGQSIQPASNGVNIILRDTVDKLGIISPHAGSWGDYTFFYIGNMYINGEIVPNGMFVHDERYDEWYVWQLGHEMTTFSTYTDPTSKAVRLISGDKDGNTYVWGEEFSTDDGLSIPYRLRTMFDPCQKPEADKRVSRLSTNMDTATGATVGVAINFDPTYRPIRGDNGGQTSGFVSTDVVSRFKTISVEISGETSDSRPEFYGYTLKYDDLDEPRGEKK